MNDLSKNFESLDDFKLTKSNLSLAQSQIIKKEMQRFANLHKILSKVSEKSSPGKFHVENYLDHKVIFFKF